MSPLFSVNLYFGVLLLLGSVSVVSAIWLGRCNEGWFSEQGCTPGEGVPRTKSGDAGVNRYFPAIFEGSGADSVNSNDGLVV